MLKSQQKFHSDSGRERKVAILKCEENGSKGHNSEDLSEWKILPKPIPFVGKAFS